MTTEVTTSSTEMVERLAAEIDRAKRWVELSMYDQINKDTLPGLAAADHLRIADFQVMALKSLYYDKDNIRRFLRDDKDAFGRISTEMGELARLASKIVLENYPKNDSAQGVHAVFWMSRDELESFDAAIHGGLPNQIDSLNFPSLAAVDEKDIARFKLEAYQVALNVWEGLASTAKPSTGILQENGGDFGLEN